MIDEDNETNEGLTDLPNPIFGRQPEVPTFPNAPLTEGEIKDNASSVPEMEVDEFTDDGVDPEGVLEGEPNVRLSAKRADEAVPKGLLNIGMSPGIVLPSKQTQLKGFRVENPSLLINQFRQYKHVVDKGTERPVDQI